MLSKRAKSTIIKMRKKGWWGGMGYFCILRKEDIARNVAEAKHKGELRRTKTKKEKAAKAC